MNMILSLFYSIVFFWSFVCSPNAFVLNECAVRNIIRKITFLIELNLMLSFNLMDKPLSLPKKIDKMSLLLNCIFVYDNIGCSLTEIQCKITVD